MVRQKHTGLLAMLTWVINGCGENRRSSGDQAMCVISERDTGLACCADMDERVVCFGLSGCLAFDEAVRVVW